MRRLLPLLFALSLMFSSATALAASAMVPDAANASSVSAATGKKPPRTASAKKAKAAPKKAKAIKPTAKKPALKAVKHAPTARARKSR